MDQDNLKRVFFNYFLEENLVANDQDFGFVIKHATHMFILTKHYTDQNIPFCSCFCRCQQGFR